MLWDIRLFILSLHILLAIIWVGGILFVGWGVFPAVQTMKVPDRRQFLISLMGRTHKLFALVGASVIFTGVLLGTVFGPIRHWDDLWYTTYGNLFFAAFLIALATLSWGIFMGYRQTMKVLLNDALWIYAENGGTVPLKKAMAHTTIISSIEVVGFMILIVIMVLL